MDIRGRRQSSNVEDRRGMRRVRTGVGPESRRRAVSRRAEPVRHQPAAVPRRRHEGTRGADAGVGPAVPGDRAGGTAARIVGRGARRSRGNLGRDPAAVRRAVRRSRRWCCSAASCSRACGTAESAMGPFYCPLDQKVYVDMSFYEELQRRFGAPGDFAQAYVIAPRSRPSRADAARHRREGAADAGAHEPAPRPTRCRCAWSCRRIASPASGRNHAARSRQMLEPGDIEEGLARRERDRRRPTSRSRRRAASCRTRSRTAARSSACAGSARDSGPASPTPAIRSARSRVCSVSAGTFFCLSARSAG